MGAGGSVPAHRGLGSDQAVHSTVLAQRDHQVRRGAVWVGLVVALPTSLLGGLLAGATTGVVGVRTGPHEQRLEPRRHDA